MMRKIVFYWAAIRYAFSAEALGDWWLNSKIHVARKLRVKEK
jgi:hypothetical protein